jgi:transglutaminase-like putative cysteine protease
MKISHRAVIGLWLLLAMASAVYADTPAYSTAVDSRMTINSDLTAIQDTTVRQTVLKESAIRILGQQSLSFAESISTIEIVEAFTEKADGRRLALDPANILTRDAATGLNAVYQRDAKVTTLIFPDVQVGDTLVYVSRTYRHDRRIPGHFSFAFVLARSVPYSTFRLTVEAAKSLELTLHASGEGLTHEASTSSDVQRHTFAYEQRTWSPEEPGAVSVWDRDPQIVITTFKSMLDLGAGYWASMQGKDVVTPEIQLLSDEITKGIESRHAQAEAIEHWVKKNIRYVLVFLGASGITPNPAPTVLRNKYGDCKDHVALMMALLRAKGIASEQVLISMGNMYRLPAQPAMLFNHVMLYLPEFALYTDPTASSSAFGVLPAASYDKPVLHISETGGELARTPPMKPEDHTATSRTVLTVGTDGQIRGETRQISTGVFASGARQIAIRIETEGRERYVETLLRALGRPGTGTFDAALPSDFSEPYTVRGAFVLNNKLPMPLSGSRELPLGMPIHKRPGVWPLGQRVAKRQTDFVCFAAREAEEIEISFADGLALPNRIEGTTIDNRYLSYRASYDLVDRTLKVRREFTSNVVGQVCSKEIEAEIAGSLQRVMRSLGAQMMFNTPHRVPAAL